MTEIVRFPTRYEPLVRTFGDAARNTFIRQEDDLREVARLIQQSQAASQSKIMFVYAPSESGAGKTTFIQSLDIFLPDILQAVRRIGGEQSVNLEELVAQVRATEEGRKTTVINVDGHESFTRSDSEYRQFAVQLNNCLRNRTDLVILWPVNDRAFADKVVGLLTSVGGDSAFGRYPIYELVGLSAELWPRVLDGILKVANWELEDAALDHESVARITAGARNVGDYLDRIQRAIAERFDVEKVGFTPPQLVFAISSGKLEVRDVCRNLRRANSYYAEASRLMMYTTKSNVAEWWQERNNDLKTCLPHIIALFNVQILALSPSSVVHAVLTQGDGGLASLSEGVTKNIGNAKTVMRATELFKYSIGADLDSREYGSSTQENTIRAYAAIQNRSEDFHKAINRSIMDLIHVCEGGFGPYKLEQKPQSKGTLLVDCVTSMKDVAQPVYIEFHHKAEAETTTNKVSIYLLGKLMEYAVNFGLAKR